MIRDIEELIPFENQKNNIPVDNINDYFLPKYKDTQVVIKYRKYQKNHKKENTKKTKKQSKI
mgnify:CR=1 FL=1